MGGRIKLRIDFWHEAESEEQLRSRRYSARAALISYRSSWLTSVFSGNVRGKSEAAVVLQRVYHTPFRVAGQQHNSSARCKAQNNQQKCQGAAITENYQVKECVMKQGTEERWLKR
jgi:hypothetical protein